MFDVIEQETEHERCCRLTEEYLSAAWAGKTSLEAIGISRRLTNVLRTIQEVGEEQALASTPYAFTAEGKAFLESQLAGPLGAALKAPLGPSRWKAKPAPVAIAPVAAATTPEPAKADPVVITAQAAPVVVQVPALVPVPVSAATPIPEVTVIAEGPGASVRRWLAAKEIRPLIP